MTVEISVPKLSATMEEAKVLGWRKAPGDTVAEGDVIVELETDKAALEVEATVGGILFEQCVEEGAIVPVGAPLARIGEAGAKLPRAAPRLDAVAAMPATQSLPVEPSGAMPGLRSPQPASPPPLRASPLARRIARNQGLELGQVRGTGPSGRIMRRDVEAAVVPEPKSTPEKAAPVPKAAPKATSRAPTGSPDGTTVTRMRQAIAAQVVESRRTIPAFAIDRWIDLGLAEDMRAAFNRRPGGVPRLTLTDMLLQAMADVLPAHPLMLSHWHDGPPAQIVRPRGVAIGLAVALDDGLMIPALDGLGEAGLDAIAHSRAAAVAAARAGKMPGGVGATLTLSNLGAAGADRFEAIINPGESAILAVGRLREAVVAQNGAIRVARGVNLTLSVDHRLIDGRAGAAFLEALATRLEGGGWRA